MKAREPKHQIFKTKSYNQQHNHKHLRNNSFLTPQKATMRTPPTKPPLEWLKLKGPITTNICKHGKKLESSWIFNGSVHWYNHFGKLIASTEYINPKS